MIEVVITKIHTDGFPEELGYIKIDQVFSSTELGDYSVRYAVERVGAIGLHQRIIRAFPRIRYNVLALVLQALNTLEPSELELENDTGASDLARRQRPIGKSLPR